MKIEVRKPFEKDINKISVSRLAEEVTGVIERLENCKSLNEISNIKKMSAKGDYFRIRIGDYRLGLKLQNNTLHLLRFLHRKEIYKFFP